MNTINLHLYLVLDAATCGERLLEVADAALQGGISVLQLRGHKTAWNKRDWYDTALALQPRMVCRSSSTIRWILPLPSAQTAYISGKATCRRRWCVA